MQNIIHSTFPNYLKSDTKSCGKRKPSLCMLVTVALDTAQCFFVSYSVNPICTVQRIGEQRWPIIVKQTRLSLRHC
jgi:hypothetical protein